ncbi:MAG: SctK family type III secretion system sorting platform protein [Opitutales bacterium]|nr:SctK family type III secretion system sorting platform protein [Opitutales bacterium]
MEALDYVTTLIRQYRENLFREIYQFNNGMLAYAHDDYLQDLPMSVLRPLAASPKSRCAAIRYAREALKLEEDVYDFSEPRAYLCLFSAEEIQRIIGYIGGICFSEQVRKTIIGREILAIKHALGNDAYTFSIRNAPLFVKSVVAEHFQVGGENLVERMLNTGCSLIGMALSGLSEAMLRRFQMKFPKNFGWDFRRNADEDSGYCFEFIKRVVKRALKDDSSVAVAMVRA